MSKIDVEINQKLKMGALAISVHASYFNTTSGKLYLETGSVLIPLFIYEDFYSFDGPNVRVKALLYHKETMLNGWISAGTSNWFKTIE